MFISTEVELEALTEGYVSCSSSLYINAFFYKLIKEADSFISEKLHELDETKPYTVSCLYSSSIRKITHDIEKGISYKIRFTFMEDSIFRAFNDSIYSYIKNRTEISIGTQSFIALKINIIRIESVEDIIKKENKIKGGFELVFQSPTCFRVKGRSIIFPEIERILKSCGERWNKYSGSKLKLSEEDIAEITEHVYPKAFKVQTEILNMKNYKIIGFTGKCSYEIDKSIEVEMLKKLGYILSFLHYSGIGYKTTMGMGQAALRIP